MEHIAVAVAEAPERADRAERAERADQAERTDRAERAEAGEARGKSPPPPKHHLRISSVNFEENFKKAPKVGGPERFPILPNCAFG